MTFTPPDEGAISWSPPRTFEEYTIVRRIGRGGMGDVYLAQDTLLDRYVAVKFIKALEPDADLREQFLIEARAAARLQHPNVLTIFRVGELGSRPFIISEFVKGDSLATIPKPLPSDRVVEIGLDLARGLAAAHRRGVLHRDIKPGNAIRTADGIVKILDFGLAKIIDAALFQDSAEWAGTHALSYAPTKEFGASNPDPGAPPIPPAASPAVPDAVFDAGVGPGPVSDKTQVSLGMPPVSVNSSSPTVPTPSSVIRGTPYYMAPELWLREPASRRSDVYSLGALLFELCSGGTPHKSIPYQELPRKVTSVDAPPLAGVVPSVDPELAAIIDRCLRRDPAARYPSAEEVREALDMLLWQKSKASIPDGNPYRGLLPFEAEHRALFFGRENEIGTILERLRTESIVVVAGDSGVGKSSLCRAGVLPRVIEGALGGGRAWSRVHMVPGRNPLAALASALSRHLDSDEAALAQLMSADPASIGREVAKQLGEVRGLIVFIDQLEELVTVSDVEEAKAVAIALGQLTIGIHGMRLLMTVRSDFLARVASLDGLGDELSRALYLLRPLSRDKVWDVIVGPARAKGVSFETDALIDTLIESTVRAEGSLPLLQFALAELWDARARSLITREALDAIGGVSGALARHADQVLLALPHDQRAAARRILMSLVTLGGTRVRRTEEEVAAEPAARAALEVLARGRLIVARDTENGIAYELAHEALINGWRTLRGWLDEQADIRAVKERLEAAALEWDRLGRTNDALWGYRQLMEVAPIERSSLTPREQAFVAASRRAIRRGRFIRNAIVVAIPVAVLASYLVNEVIKWREVEGYLNKAQRALDDARRTNDELTNCPDQVRPCRKRALDVFDIGLREGEHEWELVSDREADVDHGYAETIAELEEALSFNVRESDVRKMRDEVLDEWIDVAEQGHRLEQRERLIDRMKQGNLDSAKHRVRAWLSIAVDRPDTHIKIEHVVSDKRKLRLEEVADGLQTGIKEYDLEWGSYLVTASEKERVTVRYPVMLGVRDRLNIALELPLESEIPREFVYIPAGWFLFGGSSEDALHRSFLTTAPLREIWTSAYLIAQHETTFEEWITYLESLSAEERAQRIPKGSTGGLTGSIELVELLDGGWQLRLQKAETVYTARYGENIQYEARVHKKAQDWRKFPVLGITIDDANAYARWLDYTGRVRGARLCTEYEWERAARGADSRMFPHGDRLDPDDANFDETYAREPKAMGPDEVGSHSISRSPFGIDDLAGNAFEWTRSVLPGGEYVLRGGAYYYSTIVNQSANRNVTEQSVRDPTVGVRLCAPYRT